MVGVKFVFKTKTVFIPTNFIPTAGGYKGGGYKGGGYKGRSPPPIFLQKSPRMLLNN